MGVMVLYCRYALISAKGGQARLPAGTFSGGGNEGIRHVFSIR